MSTDDVLLQLVDRERWQRLQRHFAGVLGVPLRTVGVDRQLLVNPSWPDGLDAERAVHLLGIGEELEGLLPSPAPESVTSVTTELGVTYAAVPIRAANEQPVAYFVVGPLIVGPREDERLFRQRAEARGLDAGALWSVLLSLKLNTFSATRSLLSLLEDVGTSLAQCACQSCRLTTASANSIRILQALLDASIAATRAEGGSIMLFDEHRHALEIKAAQGLNGTVMASTRQPRGEGLAGLALQERRILLVDRDAPEARMRPRMAREDVVSSLVAPLTPEGAEEPVGVLNLRSCSAGRRFTTEHVEVLGRLLQLASAALGSVRNNCDWVTEKVTG